jgi:hypothetical protein
MSTSDRIHLELQQEQSDCLTELGFKELEQRITPLVVIAIIGILIGMLVV